MHFAKHETFHIREGWLFKGMNAIKEAERNKQLPTIFLDHDAPERLGMGRNMVRSLRFWMQATGLAEEQIEERKRVQRLTPFGEQVWLSDRYLENDGTWWLIHYQLATNREQATTWYWFFNHFAPTTFEIEACREALENWVITSKASRAVASSSLKKDIDCLLKTYTTSKSSKTPEELIESPLSRLGLLYQVMDKPQKRYRLEQLPARRLHPLLLLYVLLDRQQKLRPRSEQVGLGEVLREPCNAGRVFNLTTPILVELLAELKQVEPAWQVRFVRTAGLDQLTLPACHADEVLARYIMPCGYYEN
jgi:hypothetical protein